jgi:hypothetical protein
VEHALLRPLELLRDYSLENFLPHFCSAYAMTLLLYVTAQNLERIKFLRDLSHLRMSVGSLAADEEDWEKRHHHWSFLCGDSK